MSDKVYVIIVNYNGWYDTIECLESLLKIDYSNFQIVVVDNCSTNNSIEKIIDWANGDQPISYQKNTKLKHLSYPPSNKPISYSVYDEDLMNLNKDSFENKTNNQKLIIIKSKKNVGLPSGNNIGLKYAFLRDDFEYICFLNNDTVVEPNFLSLIIEKLSMNPSIGICSSKINYYNRPNYIWSLGGSFCPLTSRVSHYEMDKQDSGQSVKNNLSFLTGCLWVIKKHIFSNIGWINPAYFMYGEDIEYCYKVLKNNYSLAVVPESVIYHKVGASSGGDLSPFASYWMMYSRIYFILNNLSFRYKISSILFIIFTRSIKFPLWILKGKLSIVKAQIKGLINGLIN